MIAARMLAPLAAAAFAACAPAPAPTPAPATPNDAQVGAIVLAANDADISYARLAQARSANAEVKAFADHVLADHEAVNAQAKALFARLGATPEDHLLALDLRDDAAATRDVLRELSGRAFDSVYVTNEVTYHQKVLGALDAVLIPAARDSSLRALLVAVRPAVAGHLEHARRLGRTLGVTQ